MSTSLSNTSAAQVSAILAAAAGTAQLGATPEPHPELNGLLLQLPGNPKIYLVINGFRCWVPNPTTFNNLFVPGATVTPDVNIGVVSEGPALSDGAVLAKSTVADPVYLVSNGVKRWIPSQEIFSRYQFNGANIQLVAPVIMDSVPSGSNIDGPSPI